jgi:hypothetical protein
MGIISKGITMYMVMAELKEADIFRPIIFAQKAVENNASQ